MTTKAVVFEFLRISALLLMLAVLGVAIGIRSVLRGLRSVGILPPKEPSAITG